MLHQDGTFDFTPGRWLSRREWRAAYRVARLRRRLGQVAHEPVNMLALHWALNNCTKGSLVVANAA